MPSAALFRARRAVAQRTLQSVSRFSIQARLDLLSFQLRLKEASSEIKGNPIQRRLRLLRFPRNSSHAVRSLRLILTMSQTKRFQRNSALKVYRKAITIAVNRPHFSQRYWHYLRLHLLHQFDCSSSWNCVWFLKWLRRNRS